MTMTWIGWAIVHSLWQGGVIALVTAGALAATRGSRPQIRYALSLIALALMIVLPLSTAIPTNGRVARSHSILEQESSPNARDRVSTPGASPWRSTTTGISTGGAPVSPETLLAPSSAATAKAYIDLALPWVVVAWILGLLLASAKLIGGFARTRAITRRSTSKASRALMIRAEHLCDRLGITRTVRVLESIHVDVPLVIGAIRPVIVVPASLMTGLPPLQLDMLLAHELAHVRRHDYLVNLVQTVIETLLFYHPAARWISDRAREERENCCDDLAVATCGGDTAQYTSALLVLEEARGQGFGLAAAATGGSLLRRAERLLTGRSSYVELGPRWIAGVLTITAALFTGREAVAGMQASYVPVSPAIALHDTIDKNDTPPDSSRAKPAPLVSPGHPDGDRALDSLARLVRTPGYDRIKLRALEALGDMSDGRGLNVVIDIARTAADPRLRYEAVGLVARVEPSSRAFDILRQIVATDSNELVRAEAVETIAEVHDPRSVQILTDIANNNPSEPVQVEAVESLAETVDPASALTVLRGMARNHPSPRARKKALEAIVGFNDQRATIEALVHAARTDPDASVRRRALETLGEAGN